MLAGEKFSDQPGCVDPVLASYLRAFNDRLGHHERQRLFGYAAAAVGTRGDRSVTRARRDRCLRFAGSRPGLMARLRIAVFVGLLPALRLYPGAGEWAAREVFASHHPSAGFDLLDALLADGGVTPPARTSEPPALPLAVPSLA